jgi:hypothetical protein
MFTHHGSNRLKKSNDGKINGSNDSYVHGVFIRERVIKSPA